MAQKTRKSTTHQATASFDEFKDHELQATLRDFFEEEQKEKTGIWNIATIAGIAMFFVGTLYILQLLGLNWGGGVEDFVTVLPIIGAILISLVGFGFLVGDRRKVKKARKKQKQQRRAYFDRAFGSVDMDNETDSSFKKDFFKNKKRSANKESHHFGAPAFDAYAFRQSKKLYQSRTDKKLTGVCGGLGKYFGISSTIIRVLFVVTFFAGSGASLLIYIALMLALNKEPPELMDDFRM